MLRSLEGREVFREFLRSEYSEDNLLFWLACEDLKKETNAALIDEKARIIYEDYVSILSPKEVPSHQQLAESVKFRIVSPSLPSNVQAKSLIAATCCQDSFVLFC